MPEVILISPPSSDKPVRPKRRHGNAQIFDSEGEDEHESDLDKPVAKRLQQVPAEVQEVNKCCGIATLWSASAFSEALSVDTVLSIGRGVARDSSA